MYKERFWMRWVGRIFVDGRRRGDAVLQHGRAAKEVLLPALKAVAKEGEPAWSWGVGDTEGEESIAAANHNQ